MTGEAMLAGLVGGFAEPWENDWNADKDWSVLLEAAALAQKEQGRFVVEFEVVDVRAVQVNLGGTPGLGDFQHRQITAPIEERDVRNGIGRFHNQGD
jgi:hypothetical protein